MVLIDTGAADEHHDATLGIELLIRRTQKLRWPVVLLFGAHLVSGAPRDPLSMYLTLARHYKFTVLDYRSSLQGVIAKYLDKGLAQLVTGLNVHPSWLGHEMIAQLLMKWMVFPSQRFLHAEADTYFPKDQDGTSIPDPIHFSDAKTTDRFSHPCIEYITAADGEKSFPLSPNSSCSISSPGWKFTVDIPGSCAEFSLSTCTRSVHQVIVGYLRTYENAGKVNATIWSNEAQLLGQSTIDAVWTKKYSVSQFLSISYVPPMSSDGQITVRFDLLTLNSTELAERKSPKFKVVSIATV